ncbi:hypothetical protein SKTS_24960 [Sulfurimicrobium lacus]|uniref:Uncharacterized protein n=1 Tax=Sulfurimicrobium lacus TaxID=2715678 RepID=A0A6F8VE42_9PROT|nr:hypothetical protein [Sulfurimicrobium lacus]BCB27610.1 hypothetical protein SKTS_24960 [Sulfurimicrobium lacus]
MKARRWLHWGKPAFLGCLLAAIATIAACGDGWGTAKKPHQKPEQSTRVVPSGAKKTVQRAPDESRVELERLDHAALQANGNENIGNVFGATSWYVPPPPPPPPPPQPPPKPTAPPMPFTYLGLYQENSGQVIMLLKGDRLYTVAVGDVIESTYRVDRVEHGMVEMTYLPLNIKQSISTGNSS